jgi:hypothetical protein
MWESSGVHELLVRDGLRSRAFRGPKKWVCNPDCEYHKHEGNETAHFAKYRPGYGF